MRKFFYLFFSFLLILLASCSISDSDNTKSYLYRILVGEKYGFMNSEGKIVIEPQYDDAFRFFSEGLCYVRLDDKRYLIDETGAIVKEVSDTISFVYNFNDGLAKITSFNFHNIDKSLLSQSSGIMNPNAELIIPPIHYDAYVDKDGDDTYLCVIKHNRKWFITDKKGNQIGCEYDSILNGFNNGLCAVKLNGKWGYIDSNGNMTIEAKYDYARMFTPDGLARVRIDSKHLFIDKNGNNVINVDSTISGFVDNRAPVILNGEKCLIDKKGNKVCTIDCEEIYPFYEDHLATIIKNGKALKIDTMGNIVLKTNFDYIGSFDENNLAYAKNNGQYGLIDLNGKEIVNIEYDGLYYNENGDNVYIFYNKGNDHFPLSLTYYNTNGELIWKDVPTKKVALPTNKPNRWDFIEYFDANMSNLDPIEGIYYVTYKDYYQDRDNYSNIGLNDSHSKFYAIARYSQEDKDFHAFLIDGSGMLWVNKFVKLGDSNNYAIVKANDEVNYSSEGEMTIDDPNGFDFRLETGKNNWYNFFVTYKFTRDYPIVSESEQYQAPEWTGTGFAIADGYIATNYHVTNGAKTIRIKGVNGDIENSYKGFVITSDKEHDLSIIKIVDSKFESFGKIPCVIGKSNIDVGDNVFVLGYPLITSMGNEIKLTEGIISSSTGFKGDDSMYQISAAIQPGNSGGPLFNEEGNVIGVVCAKHSKAENANYAIKISYLTRLIETSGYKIELSEKNSISRKKLSAKVKKIKNYVYLIECSSK